MQLGRIHTVAAKHRVSAIAFLGAAFAMIHPLFVSSMQAQERKAGVITYITSTAAYVNLGKREGFAVGDTVRLEKSPAVRAVMEVTNIASKSMSVRFLEKKGAIVQGDSVFGFPHKPPVVEKPTLATDTVLITGFKRDTLTAIQPASAPPSKTFAEAKQQDIRGRISLQYYGITSSASNGFDYSQPAAVVNFAADNLLDMPLRFSFYSNHRYDARSSRPNGSGNELTNRVYQLSFRYGKDDAPLSATVGRFIAPAIGGVGTFDGAMATYRSQGFETGLAVGSQPEYRDYGVNMNDPKFAAYASYTRGDYQSVRYQGSVAYAQIYNSRALDRGFFYLQNSLQISNTISLYQNASFDLYDVAETGNETAFHLTDIYLSGTYRPLRWLSLTGSVSQRRNIYFLHSFGSLPFELFDKSVYRNYQASAGLYLPEGMFASVTGTYRTKENDEHAAASGSVRYSWSNFLKSETNLHLSGSLSDNIYNRSSNYGAELNRDFFSGLYVSLRVNQYHYSFSGGSRTLDRTTVSSDLLYRIARTYTLSLSYERYWEGPLSVDRIFSEASFRF